MPISVLFAASLLIAPDAPASCNAIDTALPAALAGWRNPAAAGEVVDVGRAARLTLQPVTGVTYPVSPERQVAAGTFGGVFRFTVARAGTYRVTLQRAGWIDVVRDGKALVSTAHGHGPACSSIRKIVDFALVPGEYAIQLSGVDRADAIVMVIAP